MYVSQKMKVTGHTGVGVEVVRVRTLPVGSVGCGGREGKEGFRPYTSNPIRNRT